MDSNHMIEEIASPSTVTDLRGRAITFTPCRIWGISTDPVARRVSSTARVGAKLSGTGIPDGTYLPLNDTPFMGPGVPGLSLTDNVTIFGADYDTLVAANEETGKLEGDFSLSDVIALHKIIAARPAA